MQTINAEDFIKLPAPCHDGQVSVERALSARRSVRRFQNEPLTQADVSQLLWAAQGVSDQKGYRTAPSAGALYPLEIYLVAGRVYDLSAGIYRYETARHALRKIVEGDRRADLCQAALNQHSIASAPIVLLFCTVDERVTNKYGERGLRYIFMELGHAAQNVCLQAAALGLGTVPIGAFHDGKIKKIVKCEPEEEPLYIMPVGKPKNR